MIVGDKNSFALESEISQAYERPGLRGLGSFVIHLGSLTYGVRAPDATILACSFDEVERRIRLRGKHRAFLVNEADAGRIADAVETALYSETGLLSTYWGHSVSEFTDLLHSSGVVWAPDGDEAFNDGSRVLQFDLDDRVRLIGYRAGEAQNHEASTLRDIWLEAEQFYAILTKWKTDFEAEWAASPKTTE